MNGVLMATLCPDAAVLAARSAVGDGRRGNLAGVEVPARIEIEDGTRVVLAWEDGTVAELTASQLRAECRCAACREPEGAALTDAVVAGPVPVTITDARLVGGYAVSFVFAPDGHGTGIFSFDLLRSLSPAGG
jgi:ATP-binding protein involved in chromosome partitioning